MKYVRLRWEEHIDGIVDDTIDAVRCSSDNVEGKNNCNMITSIYIGGRREASVICRCLEKNV